MYYVTYCIKYFTGKYKPLSQKIKIHRLVTK